jgi:5-formyltetrahydrofolate cyclo-ligase
MTETAQHQNFTLRQSLRHQRRQLSRMKQHQHAQAVYRRLIHSRLYRHARSIALYLAADGELDLSLLINRLHSHSRKCYLPVILSRQHATMAFAPYEKHTPLRKNSFGILEPVYQKKQLKSARQLDMVLAPLVGFDELGNRMGMGGGFYDRALAHLIHNHTGRKSVRPRFVGVAHELQKLPPMESRIWDVPLQAIVTERRLTFFD